jgi:hypothetical protein
MLKTTVIIALLISSCTVGTREGLYLPQNDAQQHWEGDTGIESTDIESDSSEPTETAYEVDAGATTSSTQMTLSTTLTPIDSGTVDSGGQITTTSVVTDSGITTTSTTTTTTTQLPPEPCENGVQDGSESDVDCGGTCSLCEEFQGCREPSDCRDGLVCFHGQCELPKTCPRSPSGFDQLVCIYFHDSRQNFSSAIEPKPGYLTVEDMETATRCVTPEILTFGSVKCDHLGLCKDAEFPDCIYNMNYLSGWCEHLGCNANAVPGGFEVVQWVADPYVAR